MKYYSAYETIRKLREDTDGYRLVGGKPVMDTNHGVDKLISIGPGLVSLQNQ